MSRSGSGGPQGVSELHSCFGDDGLLWYVIKECSDATIEGCYASLDASLKPGGERKLPIYVNFGGLRSATTRTELSDFSQLVFGQQCHVGQSLQEIIP